MRRRYCQRTLLSGILFVWWLLLIAGCAPIALQEVNLPDTDSDLAQKVSRIPIKSAQETQSVKTVANRVKIEENQVSRVRLEDSETIIEEDLPLNPRQDPVLPEVTTAALEKPMILWRREVVVNRIKPIPPAITPRQALSRRFIEKGEKQLENGEYTKALYTLEKALGLDSTNSLVHYNLARVHYHLGHYLQAKNFLVIAESRNPQTSEEGLKMARPVEINKIKQALSENR